MNTRLFPGLTALLFSLRASWRGQKVVRVMIEGERVSGPVPVVLAKPAGIVTDRGDSLRPGKAA